MARILLTILLPTLLFACEGGYPNTVAQRVRAHGDGLATVSEIFGEAERTCIAVGDRAEAFEGVDQATQEALDVFGRDYNTVVVVQFNERQRLVLKRAFHFRNPYLFIDVESGFTGSTVQCFGSSSMIQVEANESGASVRI